MADYTKDSFKTLKWNEHIRQRPGMYIGNTGDGSAPDSGIYVLLKEVVDNSVDEFANGTGKLIDIQLNERELTVRDYGRGIPLEVLVQAANTMNTGGKFNSDEEDRVFKNSVGLNGVGLKAVNATSSEFYIQSFRDGKTRWARFSKGELQEEAYDSTNEKNGTLVRWIADDTIFPEYRYNQEFIDEMMRNYSYLNTGLTLRFNEQEFRSKNGLLDLIQDSMDTEPRYEPIHLLGKDIEIVITHGSGTGENIASFVNGQNTRDGGTHLSVFKEAVTKTLKEFLKKDYEPVDIRQSLVGAVSIRIDSPIFTNQTKTKLGSSTTRENGPTIRAFIGDFLKEKLDDYLYKNLAVADIIQKKIQESEKERKAISNLQKVTREKVKKASLHNRKLRDCRIHFTDKHAESINSTLFITEGDSASGSITKSRNPNTQAVFSLRGKTLNCYQKSNREIYANEELLLLKSALNIDEDLENLRYSKVVIATDADVDGMHIRLLVLTFFLKFYPELIRRNHVYILQTPLFRVRNNKETLYCYSEEEKEKAIAKLGNKPEITRFKGLGEISPDEFRHFIGDKMRLDKVHLSQEDSIPELLEFYMGKNTMDRQSFIRENLRSETMEGNA
ncbi:MAG: ATP-binding protein [Bacteroidales bacterium]|nr:ATP-binding protein [Bacteroidales bacterium]